MRDIHVKESELINVNIIIIIIIAISDKVAILILWTPEKETR